MQPVLVSAGRQVGGSRWRSTPNSTAPPGCVTLEPGNPVTVAFLLSDDSVKSLRMVVLDPSTDAELYRSPNDIPVHLGV